MKNIYNNILLIIITIFICLPSFLFAKDTDSDTDNTKTVISHSKSVFKSIWKYEQDLSAQSIDNGIAKKIYYLTLCSDGTYYQYVQIFPSNPSNFFKVKSYVLEGKWSDKNGKLILQEYGKENAIDYTYLYSNFENIDNQYITQK